MEHKTGIIAKVFTFYLESYRFVGDVPEGKVIVKSSFLMSPPLEESVCPSLLLAGTSGFVVSLIESSVELQAVKAINRKKALRRVSIHL